MNLEEKKEFLVKRLDELKISDIKVLDVRKKSSIADYIIIGSGTSDRQIESAIGYIRSDLKKFTSTLNGSGSYFKADSSYKNGGYPILSFE